MAKVQVVPRAKWGARPARSSMAPQTHPTEAFIHMDAGAPGAASLTVEATYARVRGIQAFHMDDRGWADVGYHYLVKPNRWGSGAASKPDRPALVLEGRRPSAVPAAQLGHNTKTIAICVLAAPGEPLPPHTRYVIEQIILRHPTVRAVGGHRDVVATDCPGDQIYGEVERIARAIGRRPFASAGRT